MDEAGSVAVVRLRQVGAVAPEEPPIPSRVEISGENRSYRGVGSISGVEGSRGGDGERGGLTWRRPAN